MQSRDSLKMGFGVIWHPKAVKFLEKLPREIAVRIREKIDIAKDDPKRYVEKLVEMEDYKIRVGDYRIFVEITHNPHTLAILAIRHRREAYKKK